MHYLWRFLPVVMLLATVTGMIQYFAFGSNMNSNLLDRRTGSQGLGPSRPCVLDGYEICFDVGSSRFTPAFASVRASPADHQSVHGALYELSLVQFLRMLASEGVPLGPYRVIPVEVQPYGQSSSQGTRPVRAYTLGSSAAMDSTLAFNGKPSTRYKRLIVEGAEASGLDEDYIDLLRGLETFNLLRQG